MKNSLMLYYDLDEVFGYLTNEEAGALIKAVFAYEIRGEETHFQDRMLASSFRRIADCLDRNKVRYEETCIKRQQAALKRWEKAEAEAGEKKKDSD